MLAKAHLNVQGPTRIGNLTQLPNSAREHADGLAAKISEPSDPQLRVGPPFTRTTETRFYAARDSFRVTRVL